MFITMLLISISLLALAFVGLGISIFFKKNGKFPETGVGHNPEMRKLGLSCARSDEIKQYQLQKDISAVKSGKKNIEDVISTGCSGCSCSE